MSRPTTAQPEQHGVTHPGQAPQVAVRDGNRLLCPCCGQTIMVLKEKRFRPPKKHAIQGDPRRTWPSLERLIAEQEAHYEKTSTQEVPQEEPQWTDDKPVRPFYRADALEVPIDEKVAQYEFPEVEPPKIDKPVKLPCARPPEATLRHQPPGDWNTQYEAHQRRRRQQPLQDPFTEEGARLFAWAYYRLQRLAVRIEKEIAAKQTEIDRLQTELNGGKQEDTHQQPNEKPMNENEENIRVQRQNRPLRVNTPHAQADLGVAPGMGKTTGMGNGRGTRRHAHADEGMAPQKVLEASDRGPP